MFLAAFGLAVAAAGRPAWAGGPGCATCAHAAAAGAIGHGHELPVWEDESPLYPQLAWWTFQKTQCKQPHPCKGGTFHSSFLGHAAPGEVQTFAPLPYSPLAGKAYPQFSGQTTMPAGAAPPPPVAPTVEPADLPPGTDAPRNAPNVGTVPVPGPGPAAPSGFPVD